MGRSIGIGRTAATLIAVLALLMLLAHSAWATAPTLETSFTGPVGGTAEHIAVNEKTGEIFVLDGPKEAVDRYTSAGVLIEEILGSSTKAGTFYYSGEPTVFKKYAKIAVDNSGGSGESTLYVSSPVIAGAHVFAFKLEAGVYKEIWEFSPGYPVTGLAIDTHGDPWYTSFPHNVAVELDPNNQGAVLKEVGTPSVEDESIAFDSEDHMFVTYRNGADVVEFDPVTGLGLSTFSVTEPEEIAIDPTTNNRFVVTQSSVEVMRPDGTLVSGTPFFPNTQAVAVNGAAGKLYTINTSSNKVEVWHIAQPAPVSVAKTGGGDGAVTSAPAGIDCGATCQASFEEGETVVLTAQPESGSAVNGWTGCASEPSPAECEVTVAQANNVSVNFAKALSLTVSKTGSGTVTSTPTGINCGTTCSASYLEGTKVRLTASPAAHNTLAWQGCAAEPSADICEVTVNAVTSVSATFSPIMHALTIAMAGAGSGTVTCNGQPCVPNYPEGSTIALAASAAFGSTFAGFSGAGCSGTLCTITLEADTSVTATFNMIPPSGGGTPKPTPTPTPVPKPKPVVKAVKCKRGYVKRKVHGKMRCVKLKKHGKSKKNNRKHH
jgi:hypothetical protein